MIGVSKLNTSTRNAELTFFQHAPLNLLSFPIYTACPAVMVSPPETDREDREDAPFLAEAATPDGAHAHGETKPVRPTERSNASVGTIGFRLKVILFAMVLAVEIGFSFLDTPMVRILESIACRQYYTAEDPSKIGPNGQVPERLCKVGEVQAELAAVKGYHMFFDGLLSMAGMHPLPSRSSF